MKAHTEDPARTARELLDELKEIPPMPDIALRILELVGDPEFAMPELVRLVASEPSLTARVLRICNASLMGLSREISSVEDAVPFLGARSLTKVVVVTCTQTAWVVDDDVYLGEVGALWRHGLTCATAAMLLAERTGVANPGTAFTAGVLHDVGKVAIARLLSRRGMSFRQIDDGRSDFVALEREALGTDHERLGGLLARRWRLPPPLLRAIAHHHAPGKAAGDGLVALIHAADLVAMQLGVGSAVDGMRYAADVDALETLGLQPVDLAALRAATMSELESSADLLNMRGSGCR